MAGGIRLRHFVTLASVALPSLPLACPPLGSGSLPVMLGLRLRRRRGHARGPGTAGFARVGPGWTSAVDGVPARRKALGSSLSLAFPRRAVSSQLKLAIFFSRPVET